MIAVPENPSDIDSFKTEANYFDISFFISDEQNKKINEWNKEMDEKWRTENSGKLYYGASGGSLTYSFTPTSLGTIIKIQHANGETLDVTDYEDW